MRAELLMIVGEARVQTMAKWADRSAAKRLYDRLKAMEDHLPPRSRAPVEKARQSVWSILNPKPNRLPPSCWNPSKTCGLPEWAGTCEHCHGKHCRYCGYCLCGYPLWLLEQAAALAAAA